MSESNKDFLEQSQGAKDTDTKGAMSRAGLKWMRGKPAKADKGFGAIQISDEVTVTFRDSDLRETDAEGDTEFFRIGLSPDATVVVKQERVVELDACNCDDGGGADNGGPVLVPTRYDFAKRTKIKDYRSPFLFGLGFSPSPSKCSQIYNSAYDECIAGNPFDTSRCRTYADFRENECWQEFF